MKHSDVGPLWQHACDQATHEVQAQEIFAALVLEKAAEVCDAEANNWDDDKGLIVCAKAIRRMSAALQSGDRG